MWEFKFKKVGDKYVPRNQKTREAVFGKKIITESELEKFRDDFGNDAVDVYNNKKTGFLASKLIKLEYDENPIYPMWRAEVTHPKTGAIKTCQSPSHKNIMNMIVLLMEKNCLEE